MYVKVLKGYLLQIRPGFTVASINGGLIYFAKFRGVSESINLCVATILRVTQYVLTLRPALN